MERTFLSLRDAPNEDGATVDKPSVGLEADTDVWAEYQVGQDEHTYILVAAKGMVVEEWAVEALEPKE
jgi:hypothetical protein